MKRQKPASAQSRSCPPRRAPHINGSAIEKMSYLILNKMPEAVALHRLVAGKGGKPVDYKILKANKAYARYLGIPVGKVAGRLATEVHGTKKAPFLHEFVRAIALGRPIHFDTYANFLGKHLSISIVPLSEGSFATIFYDISQYKRMERQLSESGSRLNDIINFLPDATFAVDTAGKVILWNRAMEILSGIKAKDVLGKGNHEYAIPFYGKRRPGVAELMLKPDKLLEKKYEYFKREGDRVVAEVFVPRLRGSIPVFLWLTAKPLYAPDGSIVGVIESVRDITERKQNEVTLKLQKDQIQQLFETKERFMMDMTHELKTPISVILLNLEMLRQEDPAARQGGLKECFDLLWSSSMRLSRTVDQIMQLTKMDSIAITSERFSLPDVLQEVCNEYVPLAKSKKLAFRIAGPDIKVNGDPHLLAMAVSNMVSNALKFTDHGSVRVRWAESRGKVVISVSDTGIAIKAENQAKVFDKFFKENPNAHGSGIGLAVSAALIAKMGGHMDFDSAPGRGSTFRIIIPKEGSA